MVGVSFVFGSVAMVFFGRFARPVSVSFVDLDGRRQFLASVLLFRECVVLGLNGALGCGRGSVGGMCLRLGSFVVFTLRHDFRSLLGLPSGFFSRGPGLVGDQIRAVVCV